MGCAPSLEADVKAKVGVKADGEDKQMKKEEKKVQETAKQESKPGVVEETKVIEKSETTTVQEGGVTKTETTKVTVIETNEEKEVVSSKTEEIIVIDEDDKKFGLDEKKEEKYRPIPIKTMTEDDVPIDLFESFELGNFGGIRAKGKDFEVVGRLLIRGEAYFKKMYKNGKKAKYHGKIDTVSLFGTFRNAHEPDKVHSFTIEFNLLQYLCNAAVFAPIYPFPAFSEPMYGLAYDDEAIAKGQTEPGAWGVFYFGPVKTEDEERIGAVYFVDGKMASVKFCFDAAGSINFSVNNKEKYFMKMW